MVSSSGTVLRDAGELLGHIERLGQEPLDAAGPVDDHLVVLGQLVDPRMAMMSWRSL